MKRLFLLLLMFPFIFAAGVSHINGISVDNISHINGVAIGNISHFNGVEVESCPDYYADTNVTFAWDGDHSSGAKYCCKADGSTILGTGSLTPNTSYGES